MTKEEIKKDEIDSDTEEEEEEELNNDKEDIIALDHDTIVLDMQNAHISLSNFPINEILGFKISLKRLGLQIEETSTGVKVMDVSETKQYNIYKYVKYGDRIIMVGDEIFKFNNTNIDNVTEAFETTPRPFKLYIHRSNDNNNTKNQNDIVTIDPTTVAVDMRNANINSSLFPLHEIFGYEISMDKLGLKLEESPYGIRVLEYPEGKRLNIYKHLRQGDRIIMVGNMNYKFKNTTLNEVTAAFQMTLRTFKLYVHRPVKRVVYRTLPPDSTRRFKLRLNMDHLKEYLYSDKNKFDFLEDTFDNYSSEMLLNREDPIGSSLFNNISLE